MKTFSPDKKAYLLAAVVLILAGCETTPTTETPVVSPPVKPEIKPTPTPVVAPPEAPPQPATISVEAQALKDGIALYNNGDYNGAIKKLGNTAEIWSSSNKANQVVALKYMAFSYCVTSRPQLCRQQFERALKIDPTFELAAGEKGHPLWGPVFMKAKKVK